MDQLTQFASTSSSENIFQALGIDWKTLILQIIAFLLLVFLLGKYVYPWLMKSVDQRQAAIEAGAKAAAEAEKQAAQAEAQMTKLLQEARREATDIVTTAKDEATAAIAAAEEKAKSRAERIVTSAHEQLDKDILKARQTLKKDTLSLVALATEKVVGRTISDSIDETVMSSAIEEVR